MSLKDFILSKVFVRNLGLAFVIAVCVVILLLIWLNFYTRHGQAKPVPDFYGLTLEESAQLAKKNRLRYQVTDSVYTTVVPRGCVAEQNPRPGFKVKKWRNISLTINAFRPEMVAMPDLVDLPLRQAIALLETSGLEMGSLSYRSDLSVYLVLNQLHNGREISPDDSIQKGSVIDLVLGKGLSNLRAPVPDLIGMNLESAKNRIFGAALNLGAFIYDNSILSSEDSINAFVYKQNPEFNEDATLQLGYPVYLWLTMDSTRLPVDSTLIVIPDTLLSAGTAKDEAD